MKDAILHTFVIPKEDTETRQAFFQAWGPQTLQEPSLGGRVAKQIRDTKGNYTRIAREELYCFPPHLETPLKCIHDCEGGMEGGFGHFEK